MQICAANMPNDIYIDDIYIDVCGKLISITHSICLCKEEDQLTNHILPFPQSNYTTQAANSSQTHAFRPKVATPRFQQYSPTSGATSSSAAIARATTQNRSAMALKRVQRQPAHSSDNRLAQIHNQMLELRREMERELAAQPSRRQMELGAPCLSSGDCSGSIKHAHCRHEDFTCACLPQHTEFNSTTCLPRK